jgi:hypothetical protein
MYVSTSISGGSSSARVVGNGVRLLTCGVVVDDVDDEEEDVDDDDDDVLAASLARATNFGKSLTNVGFERLNVNESAANARRRSALASTEPNVGKSSTMNDSSPVRIELTLHSGLHVSL